ncbi:hypothetical protein BDV59DRAFT_49392 [Aspergillus ambiguus]|uniref:uncharacterized protein n=1 Tax=Aspergillus ambiguus TaxID=176160 RepID=UPI003CCDF286
MRRYAEHTTDPSPSFPTQPGQFDPAVPDQSSPHDSPQIRNPSQEQDYEPHELVVKPYAIEEPEDEPRSPSPPPPTFPARKIEGETSQDDLIDSMESLHCDSDNDPRVNIQLKRGKKRKPHTAAGAMPDSSRDAYPRMATRMQYDGTTSSPKRLRRRSKQSRDNLRGVHSRKAPESSESVSPRSTTTDASGTNTTDGSTEADPMELD